MTNEELRERAYRAVLAYADDKEDIETAIGDLIGDLLHLCGDYSVTPTEVIDHGLCYYGCEIAEEFFHEQGVDSTEEMREHQEDAIRKFTEAGVPEDLHGRCLTMMGIA